MWCRQAEILFFVGIFLATSAQAETKKDFCTNWLLPQAVKTFNPDEYFKTRELLRTQKFGAGKNLTFEQKLALFATAAEVEIDPSSRAQLKKFHKAISRVEFGQGLSSIQIADLVAEASVILRQNPYDLRFLYKNGKEAVLKELLSRVFLEYAAAKGLERALVRYGYFRDELTAHEKIRLFLRKKQMKMIMAVVFNLPALQTGLPLFVPHERFSQWTPFHAELFERSVYEGFESVWPEVRSQGLPYAYADFGYQTLRAGYMGVLVGVAILVILDFYEEIEHEFRQEASAENSYNPRIQTRRP